MSTSENRGKYSIFCAHALLASVSLLAMTHFAASQTAIGAASTVENEVNGVRRGASARLGAGDDVFQSEVIRTGAASLARLKLIDNTNVSIAASSQLVLDKFVYNGDQTASNVAFNAAKGGFRFVSGNSPSAAYKVVTPAAVIGVRGTTYDVQVAGALTNVVLIAGAANVCVRGTAKCVALTQTCQSVTLTRAGFVVPAPGAKIWSFDGTCSFAANPYRSDPPLGNGAATPSPPPSSSYPP